MAEQAQDGSTHQIEYNIIQTLFDLLLSPFPLAPIDLPPDASSKGMFAILPGMSAQTNLSSPTPPRASRASPGSLLRGPLLTEPSPAQQQVRLSAMGFEPTRSFLKWIHAR